LTCAAPPRKGHGQTQRRNFLALAMATTLDDQAVSKGNNPQRDLLHRLLA
jgi:hypothetical protein